MVWIFFAYLGAGVGAVVDATLFAAPDDPYGMSLTAWFASVLWLFAFSALLRNSSVFDPFWSIAPPILMGWWVWTQPEADRSRQALLLACTVIWSLRLTLNWARGFAGIHHEDWRYRQLREQTGGFYWIFSFLGLHFFPGTLVWILCMPAYRALSSPEPLNLLDKSAGRGS